MASYADVLKQSDSKPLESKHKLVKVEQAGPMNCNSIISNPGFFHITSRIFGHLDYKSLLQCRLVGQSWKNHVDQPLFWLKKLEKKVIVPLPGTIEYEKMLLAYGFPPFPYPIPSGMDPAMHLHMLTTDPVYKAINEKDRAEDEKAFIEQIDLDHNKIYKIAGVKLPDLSKPWYDLFQRIEEDSPLEDELRACLMKWYNEYQKWTISELHGIAPIHIASRFGFLGLVELIISYTDNPVIIKTDGWTPFHIAARWGHTEVVKFLTSKVENPNAPDPIGWTPLQHAARLGRTEIFKFLAPQVENPNAPGPDGWTPLQKAAFHGYAEIFKFLAPQVEDPNAPNPFGETPMQSAVTNGHTEIFEILFKMRIKQFETNPQAVMDAIKRGELKL